jgi:hypothetical protein
MPKADFGFESANAIYESLAPAPEPEPPRITAARKVLEKTSPDVRDQVGAELIRQAKGPAEVEALHTMVRGMLADDQRQADEALASKIAEAMKVEEPAKPEPSGPYLDDDGQLRDPSGNVVDATSEDWWDRPWANDAAKLLGPEWRAGHNPGDK